MKKLLLLLPVVFTLSTYVHAQKAAKAVYAEIGGPGLASANFDMRFKKEEGGLGFRVGIGGFALSDGFGDRASILSVPVGLNYLIGKDQKNYFEVGVGFTYINGTSESGFGSDNFSSSFGNLTLGYRLAPAKGGFFFKAQITPVFGSGFFIPYYGGIGFGYKF
ncbi:MAG TPA: hypothetical protein VGP43_08250 [Chitinophagaceae bacterium]|nr:hypothetical protein [Chitinophagaceae bacterium]